MTQFEQLVINKLDDLREGISTLSSRAAVHGSEIESMQERLDSQASDMQTMRADIKSIQVWRTGLAFVGAGMAGMAGIMGVDFVKYIVQWFMHRPDGK